MRTILLRRWVLGALVGVLLAACPRAKAAAYIKFDGIDGESKDGGHDKWIVIDSVSLSQMMPGAGGPGTCAPAVSEIVVTKLLDASSAALQQAHCAGVPIPTAQLHIHGSKPGDPYLRYELQNVLVSGYSVGGSSSGGEALPMESLSLNFATISIDVETDRHR